MFIYIFANDRQETWHFLWKHYIKRKSLFLLSSSGQIKFHLLPFHAIFHSSNYIPPLSIQFFTRNSIFSISTRFINKNAIITLLTQFFIQIRRSFPPFHAIYRWNLLPFLTTVLSPAFTRTERKRETTTKRKKTKENKRKGNWLEGESKTTMK